jgi:ATP-dependent Clp protease protease subunit
MPQSYILPQFEERTAYGFKRQDPYNKLFEDRVIFLGVQVDDASADDVMAQLLVLESQDPDRDIIMYINSPGGSFTAMTAIYDTMQYVSPQIQTVVLGQAASAASVLLAAGAPASAWRCRTRILMHQPAVGESGHGQASDIEIQAAEILRMRTWLEETMARHTNRTQEQVNKDIDRDKILSASKPSSTAWSTRCSRRASAFRRRCRPDWMPQTRPRRADAIRGRGRRRADCPHVASQSAAMSVSAVRLESLRVL